MCWLAFMMIVGIAALIGYYLYPPEDEDDKPPPWWI